MTKRTLDEIIQQKYDIDSVLLKDIRESAGSSDADFQACLLREAVLSKADLLGALATRYDCKAIDISQVVPSPVLAKMLPAAMAWKWSVIPLEYDATNERILLACADPTDPNMIRAIHDHFSELSIERVVVIAPLLKVALVDLYRSDPLNSIESGPVDDDQTNDKSRTIVVRGSILLITPDYTFDEAFWLSLVADGLRVVAIDDPSEAIETFRQEKFDSVLICDSRRESHRDLVDRIRRISPGTDVRFYTSPADLLLQYDRMEESAELLRSNLHLFMTLLASEGRMPSNHASRVGQYADQLCRQLNLTDYDRMLITNAAYLHDFARIYFGESDQPNWERKLASLSASSLDSRGYAPTISGILKQMYQPIPVEAEQVLSFETLGANIITIVDFYCDNWPGDKKLSLDQFEVVKQSLRDQAGNLFLPEVTESFVNLIRSEGVTVSKPGQIYQVLVYDEADSDRLMLHHCLENLGFDVVSAPDVESFVTEFEQHKTDIVILLKEGTGRQVYETVNELTSQGLPLSKVPVFLLTHGSLLPELSSLLRSGIEDIIAIENDLDPLLVKLNRLRSRLTAASVERQEMMQEMGTHGSLQDMNVIDLLQAMGSSGKTACINISAEGQQLIMYLRNGNIVFAECGDKIGANAVFMGLSWSRGVWSVDPVEPNAMPEQNNFRTIDSILIEGVHLLDENRLEEDRQSQSGATPARIELPE